MNRMNRKWIILGVFLVLLSLVLMGCKKDNKESEKSVVSIVDMTGKEIILHKKVNRIFVDWVDGMILPMTLGATDKLVVAPTIFDEEAYSWTRVICPEIQSVEKNDEAYMSIEKALQYKPDLVITNMVENVQIYQNAGVDAICVNLDNSSSLHESLKIVGKALGDKEYRLAEKYCDYFDKNEAMMKERLGDIEEFSKPIVYYVDGRFTDIYHSIGNGEVQGEWITSAGGKLVTATEYIGKNLEFSADMILELNPDVIFIGERNQADLYQMIMSEEILSELEAVKNKKVYCIPYGLTSWGGLGTETALQMIWAAKILYPSQFEDVDMMNYTKDFYKEFYAVDISEEEIEAILAGEIFADKK